MAFHVGQMVVCVDDEDLNEPVAAPIKGQVYTVRDVVFEPASCRPSPDGLNFVELPDRVHFRGYWVGRFRPVKQTSIEIFQQLLVNPPKEVVS